VSWRSRPCHTVKPVCSAKAIKPKATTNIPRKVSPRVFIVSSSQSRIRAVLGGDVFHVDGINRDLECDLTIPSRP